MVIQVMICNRLTGKAKKPARRRGTLLSLGVAASALSGAIPVIAPAPVSALPAVSVTVSDALVTEGNSGTTTTMDFTVLLPSPATGPVTVGYRTQNASALGTIQNNGSVCLPMGLINAFPRTNADYVTKTGMLAFAPGDQSKTVSITIIGDNLPESLLLGAAETFSVRVCMPNLPPLAVGGDPVGVGKINDDD